MSIGFNWDSYFATLEEEREATKQPETPFENGGQPKAESGVPDELGSSRDSVVIDVPALAARGASEILSYLTESSPEHLQAEGLARESVAMPDPAPAALGQPDKDGPEDSSETASTTARFEAAGPHEEATANEGTIAICEGEVLEAEASLLFASPIDGSVESTGFVLEEPSEALEPSPAEIGLADTEVFTVYESRSSDTVEHRFDAEAESESGSGECVLLAADIAEAEPVPAADDLPACLDEVETESAPMADEFETEPVSSADSVLASDQVSAENDGEDRAEAEAVSEFLKTPVFVEEMTAPARESVVETARDPDCAHDDSLGKLLVSHRLISNDQLSVARAEKQKNPRPLGSILVDQGAISAEKLLRARAAQMGISAWDPDKETPTPEAMMKVSGQMCRTHMVLPVRNRGNLLVLAMRRPDDMGAIDTIRNASGMRIEPLLADESRLATEIERYHGVAALQESFEGLVAKAKRDFRLDGPARNERAALTEADTRPVVELVNHILTLGIRMGASDVHLEPRAERVDVRYRVDGEMQSIQSIPSSLLPMLVTRLKIMADLDIVEFRIPQDGRMSVTLDGRTVDVRVSVLPNYHGQRIVLRILDKSASVKDLNELGFTAQNLSLFRTMIRRPYGMLLVTGPTGSGKTTTLYAALKELQNTARNIMTCEDPVEYEIDGVSQSQVNEKVGLTFPVQLRATLRQDPDVILVGEIRDQETAETAIRAALTGHLVLSTLHCNDAPGAIPRLLDMGIDPYLLSTCLIGVTAQRLVRKLCPHCRVREECGEDRELIADALGAGQTPSVWHARGCARCFGKGFRGREAVHEILPVSGDVASAIAMQEPIQTVQDLAAPYGYEPLQVDAIRRVMSGATTLDEAMRLIAFDQVRTVGPANRQAA